MTNEEKFLLCLYSGLEEEAIFPEGKIPALNSRRFIKLLRVNKLLRRTAHEFLVLKRYPQIVDPYLSNRWKRFLVLWEQEYQIYKETLSFIVHSFRRNNIQCCLLKGLSLNPKGMPRDMGDLDMLINDEDLQKAADIMTGAGYVYVGDRRKAHLKSYEYGANFEALKKWSNQFEFLNEKTGLLVELHTNFFERERIYSFNVDPIWNSVSKVMGRREYNKDLECDVLCAEDCLWLLAMHNGIRSTHHRASFVFRYLFDMAQQIQTNSINWELLTDHALQTSTSGFVYFSLTMLNEFYPGLVQREFLDALYNSLSTIQKKLHIVQFRCYRSMITGRNRYILLFKILLPFSYNGNWIEKLKSIIVFPHLMRSRSQLARTYGVDAHSAVIPFLHVIEPFRTLLSVLRKIFTGRRPWENV